MWALEEDVELAKLCQEEGDWDVHAANLARITGRPARSGHSLAARWLRLKGEPLSVSSVSC
jgi:hypothetical protein